jgi:hypothetical protein
MGQTKVLKGLIDGNFGTDWQTTPKTADFTAVAGQGYFVDTTSAAITVTLPSSPSAGDEVSVVDYGANASTNNITITSSDDIMDSAVDKKINYDNGAVELVYSGSTKGWIVASAANETDTALALPSIDVDYLVVAGGGGGATSVNATSYGSGGGGAGGLRTSYGSSSGGGASAETSLNLTTNTDYTVTVGAGGSAGVAGSNGSNGGASTFSTITTVGGGGGGRQSGSGSSGGSGGGVGINGTIGSGTSNQRFAGGSGGTGGYADAGGGGGAGTVGQNGASQTAANQTTGSAGDGGSGLNVSITGTSVGYAGGGAGGITFHNYSTMPSGTHGGGSVISETSAGGSGTDGTGGGGAGGSTSGSVHPSGGSGGSGVVIIRYPNTYTVTIGAGLTGSTATDGSDKVTTFTAGTGNISFT